MDTQFMEKTLVIIVADTHINSRVALRVPVFNIEGETSHATRGQRWLWENWLDLAGLVSAYDSTWRKVIVFQGDLGELDAKRRTNEIITPNKALIQAMVQETISPLVDAVDGAIFIRGTPAHTGKAAWLEEAIAQDTTITRKAADASSWYWFRGHASGVYFDLAHFLPMGSAPLAGANAANKLADNACRYYSRMGLPLPHVVSRSHNHHRADSGRNFHPMLAVCTPCWSLATEYAYLTGREYSTADVGADLYECVEGQVTWKPVYYPIKESRRIWTTQM
jgi:hypothetical protein